MQVDPGLEPNFFMKRFPQESSGQILTTGSLGGEALNCAVYTQKGASPRGHDHRGLWTELMDTCLSNTGTIETGGPLAKPGVFGLTPVQDRFDPVGISTQNA